MNQKFSQETVTESIYLLLIFSPQTVFDECHEVNQVKNYSASTASSQTGDASVALQDVYTLAWLLYVTATANSKPKHLLHMTRLNHTAKSSDMFVKNKNDRFLKIKFSNSMLSLFLVLC